MQFADKRLVFMFIRSDYNILKASTIHIALRLHGGSNDEQTLAALAETAP